MEVSPSQFWTGVGIVSLALAAAAVLWLYFYRKLFRVKAIIILAVAFVAPPGFNIAAKALDVNVEVPGPGWTQALVVIAAINWLGVLEWQSRRKERVWVTYDAFAQYVEQIQEGASKESRIKMLRGFGKDDELPDEIFKMCQVAELLWPSQGEKESGCRE